MIYFTKDQRVTLTSEWGRTKNTYVMTVLWQVGDQVALYNGSSLLVFRIWEYKKGKYNLVEEYNGGPSTCYEFKVEG